jgi:hypothetical protein
VVEAVVVVDDPAVVEDDQAAVEDGMFNSLIQFLTTTNLSISPSGGQSRPAPRPNNPAPRPNNGGRGYEGRPNNGGRGYEGRPNNGGRGGEPWRRPGMWMIPFPDAFDIAKILASNEFLVIGFSSVMVK